MRVADAGPTAAHSEEKETRQPESQTQCLGDPILFLAGFSCRSFVSLGNGWIIRNAGTLHDLALRLVKAGIAEESSIARCMGMCNAVACWLLLASPRFSWFSCSMWREAGWHANTGSFAARVGGPLGSGRSLMAECVMLSVVWLQVLVTVPGVAMA